MRTYDRDQLKTRIYDTRAEMGKAAAEDISVCIRELLTRQKTVNMIFAAAPSQNEVLAALAADARIDWTRINAFHMDEYVGLDQSKPQSFARFLKEALFDRVPFRTVSLLNGANEPETECARYAALLEANPTDVVVMGIGENGHIAFNDPPVADFADPRLVKIVELDDICRMQQVHDGCFPDFDSVPRKALTLTVPALAKAAYQFCVVPASTKAEAVKKTLTAPVGEHCPATILRTLPHATLYCDADSAALL